MTNNTRAVKIIFASRMKKSEFLTEETGKSAETKLIKDKSKVAETFSPESKVQVNINHVNP